MKSLIKPYVLSLLIILGLSTCEEKEDKPVPPSDYPKNLSEIINNKNGERAKLKEMVLYMNDRSDFFPFGAFTTDHICKYDNTTASNIEKVYANYQYAFGGPNDKSVRYTSLNSNESSTFINPDSIVVRTNGNNNYTFLFRADGVIDKVTYKSLRILSGTLIPNTTLSFTNTYDCFIMLETGSDPEDKVADVGTIRVFKGQ